MPDEKSQCCVLNWQGRFYRVELRVLYWSNYWRKGLNFYVDFFLSYIPAILASISTRETVDGWARFTINILAVFKKSTESGLRRGTAFLWVRMEDLVCKCPKIKVDKSYLIMGNEHYSDGQPGLMAGRQSVVIEWSDEWRDKMRSLQRRSRFCQDDEED